mgnify:CR=1 FL=1
MEDKLAFMNDSSTFLTFLSLQCQCIVIVSYLLSTHLFSGVDTVQSNLHMGTSGGGSTWEAPTLKTNTSADFAKEFHIFGLNWTEEFLAFSVDGTEIYRHHRGEQILSNVYS